MISFTEIAIGLVSAAHREHAFRRSPVGRIPYFMLDNVYYDFLPGNRSLFVSTGLPT
jgi:hypothetical protein